VLGVAARHIHSHSSIIHRDDYDRGVRLLVALIERLNGKIVSSFTE
jgi:putative aminopeptidase FrvX